jgi:hypothetical protein
MNQAFNSISTKDSMLISDTMKSLLVLSKKINEYQTTTVDQQLKATFHQIRGIINNQFHQLLEVVNNG